MPQRSSLLPSLRCVMPCVGSTGETGSETARVHHATRRRGRSMAARGAGAAVGDAGDGVLRSTSLAVSKPMIAGFRQGLTAAGFNEGQNVAIEYRYADNQLERLPGLVAELIRLPVAVVGANNMAAGRARGRTPAGASLQ